VFLLLMELFPVEDPKKPVQFEKLGHVQLQSQHEGTVGEEEMHVDLVTLVGTSLRTIVGLMRPSTATYTADMRDEWRCGRL